jgi:acetyltransferase-like isoleucine patch superfamily enzyme
MKGPTVKKDAKIGVNATILPRVIIGRGALVGSGAVVTRNVPERTVVAGNPARVLGKIENLRCKTDINKFGYPYNRRKA